MPNESPKLFLFFLVFLLSRILLRCSMLRTRERARDVAVPMASAEIGKRLKYGQATRAPDHPL